MSLAAKIRGIFKVVGVRRQPAVLPFKDLFAHFHKVLENNTKIMEIIAEMEDKRGGDYVFDRKFLEDAVRDIEAVILRSAYNFNAVTNNRYIDIYETIKTISKQLQQELAGQIVIPQGHNVVSLAEISDAMADAVGNKAYNLSRVAQFSQADVPLGVVVTIAGFRHYMAYNDLFDELAVLLTACRENHRKLESISQKIRLLILGGEIPPDLRREILKAMESVYARNPEAGLYSVRSSAVGEDGELSFAGLHDTLLNVPFRNLLSGYKQILASLYNAAALEYRMTHQLPFTDMAMAVIYQKMVPGQVSGVTYSLDPVSPQENVCLVTATAGLGTGVVEGSAPVDALRLSRDPPYPIVPSKPGAADDTTGKGDAAINQGQVAGENLHSGLRPDVAADLVEMAMVLERFFKRPLDIEWSIDEGGKIWTLQARQLALTQKHSSRSPELKRLLHRYKPLLVEAGMIAYRGIGAGPVWHATQSAELNDFPIGAVLVSRYSLPALARVIPHASAIVTDVGSPTGHMATVAREFRVPTIVDAGNATEVLKPDQMVTVDAERNVVYDGRIDALLHHQLLDRASFEATYEFQLLRRILKRTAPLTLVDPEDHNFVPAGCTTIHDVLRFMHEKAIQALVQIAENPGNLRRHGGRRLKSRVPLNLMVIDIGGGLKAQASRQSKVTPEDIVSEPMQALWAGMGSPEVWDTNPVAADFKGLVSSLTRTQATAVTGQVMTGLNVAVLGAHYLNLTLRVGYHFTVVDASMGAQPDSNSIFFRFIGGATDITRRSRRAMLLGAILEKFCFKVEKKGDLVIARTANCTADQCRDYLYIIGRLIGFIRQLDILMTDDGAVDRYFQKFMTDHGDVAQCEIR